MNALSLRLSTLMFLQFFIWGSWFVTLATFLGNTLGANGGQIGQAFATQSWGAILAPFVIGLIADRYFNAERILGLLHLAGAVLLYQLYAAADFTTFYPLVLAYMLCYMPTLALANSVAFRHLADPARQFARIRVWGTLGWIAAGLAISFVFAWDSRSGIAAGACATPSCSAPRPPSSSASTASACRAPRRCRPPAADWARCSAWTPCACSRTAASRCSLPPRC